MPRLIGVNIPDQKKTNIALTYIYGIGRKNVAQILIKAKVDGNKRAKDLTADEISRLQKAIETIPTEGVLRKIVSENIKRLKQIGTYRGLRHIANLPVRGQRTRSNARTKRGKRMTVGALKKEALQKQETAQAQDAKKQDTKPATK
jgi:small subunit ribosomal protein S13